MQCISVYCCSESSFFHPSITYEKYYILLRNYVLLYINYLHASWFLKKCALPPRIKSLNDALNECHLLTLLSLSFFISSSSPNVIYLCANIFLSVYEENIWINSESAKSKKFAIRISFDILLYRALFIGKENKYLLILREIIKLDGGWHGGRIIYHFSHYITKMNDDTILV